jgi:hypothetical protein
MDNHLEEDNSEQIYIIGYGTDIHHFTEITSYENEKVCIDKLKYMKTILPEFTILDYRIEIFFIRDNKYIYSGKTIRI